MTDKAVTAAARAIRYQVGGESETVAELAVNAALVVLVERVARSALLADLTNPWIDLPDGEWDRLPASYREAYLGYARGVLKGDD